MIDAKNARIIEMLRANARIPCTQIARDIKLSEGAVRKRISALEKRGIIKKYVAKIVQHKNNTAIIEAVGDQEQIKELLEGLKPFGVKELVRTGRIAMA